MMAAFFFRSPRIDQDLAMRVGLQDIHSHEPLPGQIPTTVVNFSPDGACLIIPKVAIDGKHLFFDTLNSELYNLVLFFEDENDENHAKIAISARPIWMDACEYQDKPAFKIGIRFLFKQDRLFKNLQKKFSS